MRSEELLSRFDEWERRTRECAAWPFRVALEPPFEPMFPERRVRTGIIDDARSLRLRDRLFGKREEKLADPELQSLQAAASAPRGAITELQLLLPEGFNVKGGVATRLLGALQHLEHSLSFELVGTERVVVCQLCCSVMNRAAVLGALRSYFPELKVRERSNYLMDNLLTEDSVGFILNLVPAERVFHQLATDVKLDLDPLIEVVGSLSDLAEGEVGVVQILFHPARCAWGAELEDFASKIDDVDKVLPLIRDKFSERVYAVTVRVGTLAPDEARAVRLGRKLAGSLHIATRSRVNELEILGRADHSFDTEWMDVLERETHRSGFLLSTSELLTLVHPPSATVRSRKLLRQGGRTKAAPLTAIGTGLVLGTNEHDGDERVVSVSTSERLRHTYIIGASGTGKSTLLLSMAIQDLEAGNGFAVLDPHGDLIDDILARIPVERTGDVILLDPADADYPIGFNILSAHSDLEKTLLSSDLVGVFRRLSTTFGDQMVAVLGNAVLAFLESTEGGTLLDLRRFFVDKAFRARFLETVQDPEVVHFWEREFPLLKGSPQAPLLTRLNTFLRPKLIRHMVAQKRDRLDMRSIMDSRKILLARLSHGAIGEENAHLLGSLLVAKIAQAAMSRQDEDADKRVPFFLYIDEFHQFVTPSVSSILSGARKYGLGLVLAHQEMRQLKSRSEEVMSAVLGNAFTRIVFRLGDQDARTLSDGLSFFEARDLQNLGIGEAIARVERPDIDFNLRTFPVAALTDVAADARRRDVASASRAKYGTLRGEVEARLNASRQELETSAPTEPPSTPTRKQRAARTADQGEKTGPRTQRLPGRGGPLHKYIQDLVRKVAEDKGFEVSIEETVLDGHGYVDVTLVRDELRIACEISVTTRVPHEVRNLAKCLASGFTYAVLISEDPRALDAAAAEFPPSDDRVRFLTPDGFIAFLEELPGGATVRRPPRKAADRGRLPFKKPVSPEETKRLLGTEAAAKYLGLAVQTLAKMRVSGDSPPFYKLGRQVLYDRSELEDWVAARKRRSTSDSGTL